MGYYALKPDVKCVSPWRIWVRVSTLQISFQCWGILLLKKSQSDPEVDLLTYDPAYVMSLPTQWYEDTAECMGRALVALAVCGYWGLVRDSFQGWYTYHANTEPSMSTVF